MAGFCAWPGAAISTAGRGKRARAVRRLFLALYQQPIGQGRFRGMDARPHRLSDRRRGNAAALGDGLDAQSRADDRRRSEEHTSELQSLMRISYAVFCLKKKKERLQLHQIERELDQT